MASYMRISILLFVVSALFLSCKKDKEVSPAAESHLTPLEISLSSKWILKRSERRLDYFPGLADSTSFYFNYYNYSNSYLYLTGNAIQAGCADTLQYYQFTGSFSDDDPPGTGSWCGGPNNSINFSCTESYFIIHYLSHDSLVIDKKYGDMRRYFFNKNTNPPGLNETENNLLGNPWQYISYNGVPLSTYEGLQFHDNWNTDYVGYALTDSVPGVALHREWEVLFPERSIPILYLTNWFVNAPHNGFHYFKIAALTNNYLELHAIQPENNSNTICTMVFTR